MFYVCAIRVKLCHPMFIYGAPLLYISIPSHIFFKYIFYCHVFLWYFAIRNILHCHVHEHSAFSKENRLYEYKQLCVPFSCMYNIYVRMYFLHIKSYVVSAICKYATWWNGAIAYRICFAEEFFAPQCINRSHIVNSVHVWTKAENSVLCIAVGKKINEQNIYTE